MMSPPIDADSPDDGPWSAGPSRATADRAIDRAVDPIHRHRLEHRQPAIWLWRRIVGTAFAFIVVTLGWYMIKAPDGLLGDEVLPTQTRVASAFNELRADGAGGAELVDHAAASVARLVISGLVGMVIGGPVGLVIGSAPLGRTVADPVVSLFRMVPAIAVAPLAIIWFGPGEAGIIGAVAAAVLWATADVTATVRIRSIRGQRPDVTHELASGLRQVLATAWAGVLAVETLLAPVGLGPMVWSVQRQADKLVAGIYVIGLIGLLIDAVPRVAEYLLVNGAPADRAATRARHPAARTGVRTGPAGGAG